jgi:hypothetical protein
MSLIYFPPRRSISRLLRQSLALYHSSTREHTQGRTGTTRLNECVTADTHWKLITEKAFGNNASAVTGKYGELCYEELHNCDSSRGTLILIMSWTLRWTELIAQMGSLRFPKRSLWKLYDRRQFINDLLNLPENKYNSIQRTIARRNVTGAGVTMWRKVWSGEKKQHENAEEKFKRKR